MGILNSDRPELEKDFPLQSKEMWMEIVNQDLKRGGINNGANWKYNNEIDFPVICSSEDLVDSNATIFRKKNEEYGIRMDFLIKNAEESNQNIKSAIKKGVNSIGLKPEYALNPSDWESLFSGVDLNTLTVHFLFGENILQYWDVLKVFVQNNTAINQSQGSFDFAPLLNKSKLEKEDHDFILDVCNILPKFRPLTIDQTTFHKKEKQEIEELALLLAKVSEYVYQLKELLPEILLKKAGTLFQISIPVASTYFIEIAKLRALQFLLPNILRAYELADSLIYIQAQNSSLDTNKDPYWNMLRHTSMAMSALIGGADSIHLKIETEGASENPELFQRVAINVQHILREESKMEWVSDPANGSYYIETLTAEIAEKAWEKFQLIEAEGGYIKIHEL